VSRGLEMNRSIGETMRIENCLSYTGKDEGAGRKKMRTDQWQSKRWKRSYKESFFLMLFPLQKMNAVH